MLNTNEFHNQTVRDLIWLLTSPALCHCTVEHWQLPTLHRDTLVQLAQDSGPLESFVGVGKRQRLGHYVEKLWLFYLSRHPDLQLMTHNHVIYNNKRTVGEFDLLLLDHRDNQVWHLELAIKYYLGLEQAWGAPELWTHWLGPGCRDSLDHKWHKLRYQQLTLSQRPEAQTILAQLRQQFGIDDTVSIQNSSLTRGILFYPQSNVFQNRPLKNNISQTSYRQSSDVQEPLSDLPAPNQTNDHHLMGQWITWSHWLEQADLNSDWLILKKPYWLALPHKPLWQDTNTISNTISQELSRGPVYIVEKSDQARVLTQEAQFSNKQAEEIMNCQIEDVCDWKKEHIQRYFIVPDQWPNYLPLPWHQLHPEMSRLDYTNP